MSFYDYHTHSNCSPDTDSPMIDNLDAAFAMGVNELCMTDHLELNFPSERWRGKEIDMDAYLDLIAELRPRYLDEAIAKGKKPMIIKQGIEAGVTCADEDMPHLIEVLDNYRDKLDFVIASAHSIEGMGMFEPVLHEKYDFPQMASRYIEGLLEGLKKIGPERFDCVGHVDFPIKAALRIARQNKIGDDISPEEEYWLYKYDYVREPLDEIYKMVIENGKCIEFNTSPLVMTEGRIPNLDWLKRYKEMGGEYITIGSDGHVPERMGLYIREAAKATYDCGIKYVATFDRGVPEMHDITTLF